MHLPIKELWSTVIENGQDRQLYLTPWWNINGVITYSQGIIAGAEFANSTEEEQYVLWA